MGKLQDILFSSLIFRLTPVEPMPMPPGNLGNVLRGAFGLGLKRNSCRKAGGCRGYCTGDCLYGRVFEPSIPQGLGPSGIAEAPRPFVFLPRANRAFYTPGETLEFGMNLFGWVSGFYPHFIEVFRELEGEGLGPARARFRIKEVVAETPGGLMCPVYLPGNPIKLFPRTALSINEPPAPATGRFRMEFVSPMQIKSDGRQVAEPTFAQVFKRLRDRISAIAMVYGPGQLAFDFRALGELSERVRTAAAKWRWRGNARVSTRTGLAQDLSGVEGWAEFDAGSPETLARFLPWMELGRRVSVGKGAPWGLGQFNFEAQADNQISVGRNNAENNKD